MDRLDPTPALKAEMSADVIDLHRPDLERLIRDDPPLTLVQERRRSVQKYGSSPIGVRQLGEFLYRVGHVKEVRPTPVPTPGGLIPMEFAPRPSWEAGQGTPLPAIKRIADPPSGVVGHLETDSWGAVLMAPLLASVPVCPRQGEPGRDRDTVTGKNLAPMETIDLGLHLRSVEAVPVSFRRRATPTTRRRPTGQDHGLLG